MDASYKPLHQQDVGFSPSCYFSNTHLEFTLTAFGVIIIAALLPESESTTWLWCVRLATFTSHQHMVKQQRFTVNGRHFKSGCSREHSKNKTLLMSRFKRFAKINIYVCFLFYFPAEGNVSLPVWIMAAANWDKTQHPPALLFSSGGSLTGACRGFGRGADLRSANQGVGSCPGWKPSTMCWQAEFPLLTMTEYSSVQGICFNIILGSLAGKRAGHSSGAFYFSVLIGGTSAANNVYL